MGNENKVESLDNNEVEKVTGGIDPLIREEGYEVDSVCYNCNKNFKEYVDLTEDKKTGRPPICPECMRKWREESKQKNPKFKVDVKKFLKEVEKINK